ncbi:MAG: hypothetical protein STSR0004_06440 [Peptococcaceae bacterium]
MFRENKDHLQTELFNSYSTMNPKIQASLQGTWAPLFYEQKKKDQKRSCQQTYRY